MKQMLWVESMAMVMRGGFMSVELLFKFGFGRVGFEMVVRGWGFAADVGGVKVERRVRCKRIWWVRNGRYMVMMELGIVVRK